MYPSLERRFSTNHAKKSREDYSQYLPNLNKFEGDNINKTEYGNRSTLNRKERIKPANMKISHSKVRKDFKESLINSSNIHMRSASKNFRRKMKR